ncbi:F-box domain-containing protein [Rutstroemia sp. NJR-2017a BVV2]|nr:F-box domain-containing protein [Rutstroemia sp. NJR-2017a BVV2]
MNICLSLWSHAFEFKFTASGDLWRMENEYTWDGALQRAKLAVLANDDGNGDGGLSDRDFTLPVSSLSAAPEYPSSTFNMKLLSQMPYSVQIHNNPGRNFDIGWTRAEQAKNSRFHGGSYGYHSAIVEDSITDSQRIEAGSALDFSSTNFHVKQRRPKTSQKLNKDSQDIFDLQHVQENRDSRCPSLSLSTTSSLVTNDSPAYKFSCPTRSTGCTAVDDTEDNPATPTLEPSPKVANINQTLTHSRSPSTTFVPSSILNGGRRTMSPDRARKVNEFGLFINPNYKGEITDFDLRNAMCPSDENCAVRIHRIDSNATLYEIFQIITHGKVLSFHLNPAVEGIHAYAAARLVFITRAAAESFIFDARSPQGLHVRGQRIEALWNRDKVSSTETRYEKMSRVIRIKGPPQAISVGILTRFFRTQFAFQLVSSKEWVEHDGYRVVELAFSSIRAQSESAVKCFRQFVDQKAPDAGYRVWYSRDPCCPIEASPSDRKDFRQMGSWR